MQVSCNRVEHISQDDGQQQGTNNRPEVNQQSDQNPYKSQTNNQLGA
jgi:hypothetical protein